MKPKASDENSLRETDSTKLCVYSWQAEAAENHSFVGHKVSALTTTSDATFLIAGTEQGSLLVWHAASGRLISYLPERFTHVTSLCMDPKSHLLVVGCNDGLLHWLHFPLLLAPSVADASLTSTSNPVFATFSSHALSITDMRVSGTGTRLYTVSADQSCRVWDVPSRTLILTVTLPTTLRAMALSPMEDFLFVGGHDGNAYKIDLWKVSDRDVNLLGDTRTLPEMCVTGDSVHSLAISVDGTTLVTGGSGGSLKVWSTASCQLMKTLGPVASTAPVVAVKTLLIPTAKLSTLSSSADFEATEVLASLSSVPYQKQQLDSVPIALKSDPETHPIASLSNEIASLLQEANAAYRMKGPGDNIFTQYEQSATEIERLKGLNDRWKKLSNNLFSAAFGAEGSATGGPHDPMEQ